MWKPSLLRKLPPVRYRSVNRRLNEYKLTCGLCNFKIITLSLIVSLHVQPSLQESNRPGIVGRFATASGVPERSKVRAGLGSERWRTLVMLGQDDLGPLRGPWRHVAVLLASQLSHAVTSCDQSSGRSLVAERGSVVGLDRVLLLALQQRKGA